MPKAPVRGRSQLSPTGAFNPAAASPAEELDRLIESSTAVNGKLSRDDIRVLPLLRSAAVVKGRRFPRKVRDYFETMMELVGYQPLPAV
jgi:glutaredoxin 2